MARMLLESASTGGSSVADSLNSDLVVILSGLLCALICVLGLGLVARCACTRRWARAAATAAAGTTSSGAAAAAANKGVKKEILRSLPIVTYVSSGAGAGDKEGDSEECAICLVEFEDGEAVRVLPQCDHRFHAACIDTWLRAHSSCPSCRRVLVAAEIMPPGERSARCGARSGGGISALWSHWKSPASATAACDAAEGPEFLA
uniref:RING-type E3 ubiquitin transferase n=1 Tax=Leersia perrieri TaxID=77586 RepID=A0A0D9VJL5_9ORYZ